jgi:hypothetical protein
VVETRRSNHRCVFIWFASWWRNHQFKQAEKPHSKSSVRKALDGPATRPKTPLAVENGVGKLTAPERGAPNVGMGKRAWRTPIPHLSLFDRKAGQGLIVFGDKETSNIQHPIKKRSSGCASLDVPVSQRQKAAGETGGLVALKS